MSKWLIAIMTCHRPQNQNKANAQRWSWVEDARQLGIDVRFFLGNPAQPYRFADEEYLDVDDSYYGIPRKVQEIFRWGARHDYEWISKCDDDVYAVPKRLAKLPLAGDYVGRFRAPYGCYPAHFASGFFYTLSNKAARIVADTPYNGDWMDERFVANALAVKGIFGKHDSSSYVVSGPFTPPADVPRQHGTQYGTVFCQYGPKQITELHELMGQRTEPPIHILQNVPRVSLTAGMLAVPPNDKIPMEKQEALRRER